MYTLKEMTEKLKNPLPILNNIVSLLHNFNTKYIKSGNFSEKQLINGLNKYLNKYKIKFEPYIPENDDTNPYQSIIIGGDKFFVKVTATDKKDNFVTIYYLPNFDAVITDSDNFNQFIDFIKVPLGHEIIHQLQTNIETTYKHDHPEYLKQLHEMTAFAFVSANRLLKSHSKSTLLNLIKTDPTNQILLSDELYNTYYEKHNELFSKYAYFVKAYLEKI